ncbi:hypothetical protein [Sulfolobus polyhedral virus 1]|uniref:Uncharacterized protein n=2 Tax=Alphaportoglobovirus TaxID=2169647 RepID=A0A1W6I150_SPV1|nr:hypothetical protein DT302_gp10 [Sulfolobus polyhedral virus 1]YP_010084260.1 hypothetical protein KM458_gp10 [Sulfolobus polyhedral virus 2]ARM37792.1 hypothetical protein [Sulfolobus polyhedral virus 1]AZI76009.1 hypothetical protein SPV2_gp10 [Sulfolobus polyhedral virus 2]
MDIKTRVQKLKEDIERYIEASNDEADLFQGVYDEED